MLIHLFTMYYLINIHLIFSHIFGIVFSLVATSKYSRTSQTPDYTKSCLLSLSLVLLLVFYAPRDESIAPVIFSLPEHIRAQGWHPESKCRVKISVRDETV